MKLHKMVAQELGLEWVRHMGNQVHLFRNLDSGKEKIIKIVVALQFLNEEPVPAQYEDDEQVATEIPAAFRRAFEQPAQSQEDDPFDEQPGPLSLHDAMDEILRRWRGETQ